MKKNKFMEGAIIATLAIFISKFIGIIYVIPFKIILDYEGGALYGYAYQIYNFFLTISTAGIPLAISKLTSEFSALGLFKQKEYMFKTAKKIILIFSCLSFLLCFIFAPFIAEILVGSKDTVVSTIPEIAFAIRCISLSVLVVPLLSVSRGYLQGHGYMSPASFSQVIEQIVRVIIIIGGSFIAYKVLNFSLRDTIGIALLGSCIGAIIGYLYLGKKIFSIRKDNKIETESINKEEKKEIFQKIIFYAIPFIVINIANSLYSFTDLSIMTRILHYLGFSKLDVTTINSIFTTYGSKMNTIVTSIATGIALSLIPSIAKSYAKKDYKDINDKFNKTMQIFFYVALPLAIFMSIFAKQIWTIFFGYNEYGIIIMRFSIIVASIDALYIMICNGLQGLNKTKLIYTCVLFGLGINLILDAPLMILFNKIGIYPFYGAILATLIGYIISLIIPLVSLKKEFELDYSNTIRKLPKLFGVYLIMIFLSLTSCAIINNVNSRLLLIGIISLIGIILIVLYYLFNKKEIEEILGKSIEDMIKKKVRD